MKIDNVTIVINCNNQVCFSFWSHNTILNTVSVIPSIIERAVAKQFIVKLDESKHSYRVLSLKNPYIRYLNFDFADDGEVSICCSGEHNFSYECDKTIISTILKDMIKQINYNEYADNNIFYIPEKLTI